MAPKAKRVFRFCCFIIKRLYTFNIQAFIIACRIYFSSQFVLLPPASSFCSMFLFIKSLMSLIAVSFEHFAIFAHFEDVNLPSNPSKILFNSIFCLSFIDVLACLFQKSALNKTLFNTVSVDFSAFKNLSLHFLRRLY